MCGVIFQNLARLKTQSRQALLLVPAYDNLRENTCTGEPAHNKLEERRESEKKWGKKKNREK